MTVLQRVSQKEMQNQTGFKSALGYTFPKENKILIREDLPKKIEHKVIAHEEEHILKGEEGPGLFDFIGNMFGAHKQSKSADKATAAQERASQEQIAFATESRDLARGDQAPYREAGYTALDALMSMTGLGGPQGQQAPRQGPRGGPRGINAQSYLSGLGGRGERGRFAGRNDGGALYNINELGPENIYKNGSYSRTSMPQTIPPDPTGYVAPNIQGRALGGPMPGGAATMVGWGGPQRFMQGGGQPQVSPPQSGPPMGPQAPATIDNNTGAVQENPGGVEGGYNFKTDPGYEFRLGEGQRVLERGASAAGGLLSGGYARRATRYGQDYASNEYSNVYNRIASIAGIGQTSATNSGNAALQYGQQAGNAAGNAGYARASGYTAQGNIWGNALNSAGGYFDDLISGSSGGYIDERDAWGGGGGNYT